MTIFLAGAHGVGKTFLARTVAATQGLVHVTASELIRQERGRTTWTDDGCTDEVEKNQEALIAAMQRRASDLHGLLLDGHFVLRDAAGNLVRLGVDVFSRLEVRATILMEAPEQVIAGRLKERTGTMPDLEQIRELLTDMSRPPLYARNWKFH